MNADSGSPVTEFIWERSRSYLPPHPHNGLLDLWGQVGLLGVCAFLLVIVPAVVAGLAKLDTYDHTTVTGLMGVTTILLFGISEPTYLGPWLVLTFVSCALLRQNRRIGGLAARPFSHEGSLLHA